MQLSIKAVFQLYKLGIDVLQGSGDLGRSPLIKQNFFKHIVEGERDRKTNAE